ncbi:MAG: cobalt transport protein [Clostridiales bacterium]|nr:cobalt transport protein [Clostridiales bacterium]
MRRFSEHNPIAVAVYFLCVLSVAMFSMDPVILIISLTGALALHFRLQRLSGGRTHLYTLALCLFMTLINPLVSHHGATVLFVMNHNPVTLEALLYGTASAGMIAAVLYWFRSFTCIMTSDRLLYLFGALSPKLSLILSMAMRYVPLFGHQARRTRQAQQALGLYREDNLIDSLRGDARIFSVLMTWALENGVITADSMAARGYGIGRRSRFSIFRFTLRDGLLILLSLLLAGGTFWAIHAHAFTYYPVISAAPATLRVIPGFAAYALLALLPLLIDAKEAIRWRCLQSGI